MMTCQVKFSSNQIKNVMLVIMLVSLSNFLAGSLMGPENEIEQARGFKGYSCNLTSCNSNQTRLTYFQSIELEFR